MKIAKHLPEPTTEELAHSNQLRALICQEIDRTGALNFARYMALALYAPGLGYYSAGTTKFGRAGDFVTAPEISPLFGFCVARQCQPILTSLTNADILELGAGSGKLAAHILQYLQQQNCLPAHYYIVEISSDLKQRQQQYLQQHLSAELFSRCIWLDSLENFSFSGMIIANEVMDALPVHLFKIEKGVQELYVTHAAQQLQWQFAPATTAVKKSVADLKINFAEGYQSEINLNMQPWLTTLSQILKQGAILLFDYGFPRAEYYHPQRNQGTLLCHYRQHAHDNPLLWPGLQDITAHVDFTAVAEAAENLNLDVTGYTNQANFLMNMKITQLLSLLESDSITQINAKQALKKLLFPGEMGEMFKAMALTRNLPLILQGFALSDQRFRL
jgi:SAM-dependent MidA family methyltransferase